MDITGWRCTRMKSLPTGFPPACAADPTASDRTLARRRDFIDLNMALNLFGCDLAIRGRVTYPRSGALTSVAIAYVSGFDCLCLVCGALPHGLEHERNPLPEHGHGDFGRPHDVPDLLEREPEGFGFRIGF